ncbi:hypothetical protein, conserved [Eimeria necatrix]|uniref:Uncharacterized protein n=1 Tax=Eimeria necatrix TaxID=51315 RepID=U6MJE1_9EIME|nr:hypothetical protein, conserved [Eimeria necatrix]CDJ63193.1 hypothetical protein, conserved [Eimeria necatrix]
MSQPLLTLAAAISEMELTVNSFLFFCELLAAAAAAAPEYPDSRKNSSSSSSSHRHSSSNNNNNSTRHSSSNNNSARRSSSSNNNNNSTRRRSSSNNRARRSRSSNKPAAAATNQQQQQRTSSSSSKAAAAAAMLGRSWVRRSFFRSGYGRLSAAAAAERRLQVFFVSLMFLLPSLYLYSAGSPQLLQLCMQRFRWVEVPPQADPRLLRLRPAAPPDPDAAS